MERPKRHGFRIKKSILCMTALFEAFAERLMHGRIMNVFVSTVFYRAKHPKNSICLIYDGLYKFQIQ